MFFFFVRVCLLYESIDFPASSFFFYEETPNSLLLH